MRIFVKVKPNAKEPGVIQIDGSRLLVSVKEPPREGRANFAVERTLVEYFKVPPSRVRIVSGHASREKTVQVDGMEEEP